MKKSTGIVLGVLGGIVLLAVIIVGWGISTYNGIVSAQAKVENTKSTIQTQLQRRNDLVPNLVNTVKGYAAHEEKIFADVAEARTKLSGAGTIEEQDAANTQLSGALSRLLAIVENYPDLKANENFLALQTQLESTENRINVARIDYNNAVQSYNVKLRRFPSSIIAGMYNFDAAQSFKGSEGIESVPDVSF